MRDADRPQGYLAAIKAFAGTKICRRCQVPKSVDCFNRLAAQPDGFQPLCRICHKAYLIERRKAE